MEKRKYPRVKICNSISYVGLDEDGNVSEQSMGMALDISQNGILMETTLEVESENLSLMVTTLDNKLIEIEGEVAYCRKAKPGKFKTGVILRGTHDDNVRFVRELIRAYHYQNK